jgi:hypothetical protein
MTAASATITAGNRPIGDGSVSSCTKLLVDVVTTLPCTLLPDRQRIQLKAYLGRPKAIP